MKFFTKFLAFFSGRSPLTVALYCGGILFLASVVLGLAVPHQGHWLALLWAVAGVGIGAFFGILFGIPHVVQQKDSGSDNYRQLINGALEQVSDWLTKMVVGLGLVQLGKLPDYVLRCARPLEAALGNDGPQSHAVAIAVVIFYPTAGFLSLYLLTRLFLAKALAQADLDALRVGQAVETQVAAADTA